MNHGFELFYISNKNEIWLASNKEDAFHKKKSFYMAVPIN